MSILLPLECVTAAAAALLEARPQQGTEENSQRPSSSYAMNLRSSEDVAIDGRSQREAIHRSRKALRDSTVRSLVPDPISQVVGRSRWCSRTRGPSLESASMRDSRLMNS